MPLSRARDDEKGVEVARARARASMESPETIVIMAGTFIRRARVPTFAGGGPKVSLRRIAIIRKESRSESDGYTGRKREGRNCGISGAVVSLRFLPRPPPFRLDLLSIKEAPDNV